MTPWRNSLVLVAASALLGACDGDVRTASPTVSPDARVIVRGRATKGPMAGARIELLAVDARGRVVGEPVSAALTDDAGNWTSSVPVDHGGLLVRSLGGRFIDESDPNLESPRTIELSEDEALLSFLPAGERTTSVTLLSNALVRKSQLEVDDDNFIARLSDNRNLYTAALGLDPIATAAADPLAPEGTSEERRYGLIAGGLAYALNALAIGQGLPLADFRTIELLLSDLVDCRLDGIGIGGQVVYDASTLSGRTLDDEIVRFRNNHFDEYADLEVPVVGLDGCPAAAGTSDVTPPVFVSESAALVLAADNAEGVPASGPLLEQGIARFSATDDRDVAPRIDVNLPAVLPLGTSDIDVLATDGWGNIATTRWRIDVRDLDAPQLMAPADVNAMATGVRTPVSLGSPVATDNVSDIVALQITSDAPLDGFPVGETEVTWRVQDEAGLVTTAQQTVTITGAQPQVVVPATPLLGAVGSAVDMDLSVYFADPFDARLTFALTGLPTLSGLSFDPLTGRLTGIPSAADFAASPLQLEVSTSNGQFDASVTVTLGIAPQTPVFALSSTTIELEEDFPEQRFVASLPLAPTPDGAVVYSVAIGQPIVNATIDSAGQLGLTAVPDAFGETTIDVIATNLINGQTFDQRLAVGVQAINDPPVALMDASDVTAVAASQFSLDVGALFADVDDASLDLAVTMQPRSLGLGVDGVLRGTALESEASVGVYPVIVTATDGQGASATTLIRLDISVPDRDADGLSDAAESALGTDPDNVDSDGDGVDDATEVAAGSDPALAAAAVIYVATSGDNGNDGGSFASALRDLDGLSSVPSGISVAQPTFVLMAADEVERYGGSLWLMPPCDHIVLAGSISPADGRLALTPDSVPRTTMTAIQSPSLEIDGCRDVRVVNLAIEDNTRHAMHVADSAVTADNVHLRHNRAQANGGALNIINSDVTLRNAVLSGNDSDADGGAVAITGNTGSLEMRNVVFHGNAAAGDGGGLYVDGDAVNVALNNALMTGNAAGRGAGVFVAMAASVGMGNATVVYNRNEEPGAGTLVDANDATLVLRDSVVYGNTAGQGGHSAIADSVDSDFNSMDRDPIGPSDLALDSEASVFGERYRVNASAQAIDLGSTSASAAGVAALFSASGSLYPDEGTVDRGYHERGRSTPGTISEDVLDGSLGLPALARTRYQGYAPLDVTPRVRGIHTGGGHRVALTPLNGRSDLVNVVTTADNASPAVYATDLGDGRYRLYLDTRPGAATQFALTVDGVMSTQILTLPCAPGTCVVQPLDFVRP